MTSTGRRSWYPFATPAYPGGRRRRFAPAYRPQARLALDVLELRCLPATFAGAGPTLTITLDHPGEAIQVVSDGASYAVVSTDDAVESGNDPTGGHVTGFGTTTARIDSSAYSQVSIQSTTSGATVTFADSGAHAYTSGFAVTLEHDQGVAFTGVTTFANVGLTINVAGPVTSAPGSSLSLSGASGKLALTSSANGIALSGTVTSSRTTTLTSAGGPLSVGAVHASQLVATATGFISQTAPITAGSATFTVQGNYGITLTDPGNAIGTVSLNNPSADATAQSAVQFVNGDTVALANCAVGLSTFFVKSVRGDVTEPSTAAITQSIGAGQVTITAGGTNIDLIGVNDISGKVALHGAAVTTVTVQNNDTQAPFPDVSGFTQVLNSLTVNFDNAPAELPQLTVTNLNVTANGISLAKGALIDVSGTATFNGRTFGVSIGESGSGADQSTIGTLQLTTTGQAGVNVFTRGDTILGDISVGSGGLSIVTLNGKLTQGSGTQIVHTNSLTTVIYGENGVDLSSPNNNIPDTLSLLPPSGNFPGNGEVHGEVTINASSELHLNVVLVTGNLNVTATGGDVKAVVLQVGGSTSINASDNNNPAPIDLSGNANTFGGSVSLSGSDVTVAAAAGVQFGNCATSSLTVTANTATSLTGTAQAASATPRAKGAPENITHAPGTTVAVGSATIDTNGAAAILDLAPMQLGSLPSLVTLTLDTGSSTSDPSVINVNSDVVLAGVTVGGGDFKIKANGSIAQPSTNNAIAQSGSGTVELDATGGTQAVDLEATNGNTFSEPVVVQGADVTVTTAVKSTLAFGAGSAITGALTVNGDGTFSVPAGSSVLQVGRLDSSAAVNTIASGLTTAGTIVFEKGVQFQGGSGGLTITTANNSSVTFDDNVTTTGPLSFNTGNAAVVLDGGTWSQGANDVTFSGSLDLKSSGGAAATLQLAGGSTVNFTSTLSGPVLLVEADSTLAISGGPNPVTIDNGAGHIEFDTGARLGIDFASSAQLVASGTGVVTIANVLLVGSGLASATGNPVVTSAGRIDGQFEGSSSGPFLAESDIVTATYSGPTNTQVTTVTIAEEGTAAQGGIADGQLANGDTYHVQASLGTSAGLVVITNGNALDVVVRSNSSTSTTTSTLTISTTTAGTATPIDIDGVAVYGNTNIAIDAPNVPLQGDLLVNPPGNPSAQPGALASLDVGAATGNDPAHPLLIESGGPATATTTIMAPALEGVQIALNGALSDLNVGVFGPNPTQGTASSASAQSFGTLDVAGDLDAQLATADATQSIGSVVVGGKLMGLWKIAGGIGSISAATTSGWTLVDSNGAVGTLDIAGTATNTTVTAGTIGTLTATGWSGGTLNFGSLTAGSIGAGGLAGMTVNGHAKNATDVQKLTVQGDVVLSTLTFSGSVDDLEVDGGWLGSTLTAATIGNMLVHQNVDSSSNGGATTLSSFTVNGAGTALSIGEFKVGGEFEDNSSLQVNSGNVGTFDFEGLVSQSSITVGGTGQVGQFTLHAGASSSGISVAAVIVNFQSGTWTSSTLDAAQFGSFVIDGDLTGTSSDTSKITSNTNTGSSFSILSFISITVTGDINETAITGRNGVGSFTVGANGSGGMINDSSIVVGNTDNSNSQVGQIQQMTASGLNDVTLDANTLGTIVINGSVENSDLFIGARNTSSPAVESLTVTGDWYKTPLLTGLGVDTIDIDGIVTDSAITIGTDTKATAAENAIQSFTAGQWVGSQLIAVQIDSFVVKGNAARGLPGNFVADGNIASVLSVTSSSGSITTFEVNGNLQGSQINVVPSVQTFRVDGNVQGEALAIAYAPGASIGLLAAGVWQDSSLTTTAVGQWQVSGDLTGSLINITGAGAGNMALGRFSTPGTVAQSTFQISAGDVGSFTAGQFDQSTLLVGYRLPGPFDIATPPDPNSLYWTANLAIHQFATTGASPSFVQSNVAAAKLGTVTLSGVAPAVPAPTVAYGVLFRQSAGPGGPIEVSGQTVFPGYQDGQFAYVAQGATLTAVTVPSVAVSAGQTTVLTASVTSASGTPVSGTLTFSVRDALNNEVASGSIAIGPGGGGSVTIVPPAPGTYRVLVTYSGSGAFSASGGIGSLTVAAVSPADLVVLGSLPGVRNVVRVFSAETRALITQFVPYPQPFRGGVRVAVGDVTGDGVPDVVTAPGRGSPAVIEVFNAITGALENRFEPYPTSYRGGVRVAVGSIVNGGPSEILVQIPGQRRVDVFNGQTGANVGSFPGVLLTKYVSGQFPAHHGAVRVARHKP